MIRGDIFAFRYRNQKKTEHVTLGAQTSRYDHESKQNLNEVDTDFNHLVNYLKVTESQKRRSKDSTIVAPLMHPCSIGIYENVEVHEDMIWCRRLVP